jgi:hypothetical protein
MKRIIRPMLATALVILSASCATQTASMVQSGPFQTFYSPTGYDKFTTLTDSTVTPPVNYQEVTKENSNRDLRDADPTRVCSDRHIELPVSLGRAPPQSCRRNGSQDRGLPGSLRNAAGWFRSGKGVDLLEVHQTWVKRVKSAKGSQKIATEGEMRLIVLRAQSPAKQLPERLC